VTLLLAVKNSPMSKEELIKKYYNADIDLFSTEKNNTFDYHSNSLD
jgi:hypothetical protein